MRVTINLATRPFIELRPVYAQLRLAMAALAAVAIGLGVWLYVAGKKERAAQEQMDALVRQTEHFQQERAANEARMRQPQNRAVLERAQFLNGVFAQKAFSWTSVMMDLEQVLPAGVQVTSITPSVAADGEVSIQLRVNGPRELAVDLMRNLEHSRRFLQPRLVNESAQTQENGRVVSVAQTGVPGVVEFDILSGYNPLPVAKAEKTPAPAKEISAAAKAGAAMGASKKVSTVAVPNGANARRSIGAPGERSTQLMAPGNQAPQRARPPVSGGGR